VELHNDPTRRQALGTRTDGADAAASSGHVLQTPLRYQYRRVLSRRLCVQSRKPVTAVTATFAAGSYSGDYLTHRQAIPLLVN